MVPRPISNAPVLQPRPYRSDKLDLPRVLDLFRRQWLKAAPEPADWHPGDLLWQRYQHEDRISRWFERALLWEVDGRLAGFSMVNPRDGEVAIVLDDEVYTAPNLIVARVTAGVPSGPGIAPTITPVLLSSDEVYQRWRKTNVQPQKQFGYVMATASVPLGDLTSEQFRVLADICEAYGDGTVRVSPDQNLVIRWVPVGELRELYRRLAAASLRQSEASTVADVTSCRTTEA